MINGELRSQVDKLWTEFWTGGITNPLMVIEQISFLMFARLLDIRETREEKKAKRTKKSFRRIFDDHEQELRWHQFKNKTPAEEMHKLVRDKVFPHFKSVAIDGAMFGEYMKDAQLMIQKPSLLVSAVSMIDKLPLTEGDTKGDLYEYLLSKLTTAGSALRDTLFVKWSRLWILVRLRPLAIRPAARPDFWYLQWNTFWKPIPRQRPS